MKPISGPIFLIIAVFIVLTSSSCSAARKTDQEKIMPPTPAYLLPSGSEEIGILSGRLAGVAESVPGVRCANVILTRTTVIAGLQLYSNTNKDEVFKEVAAKLDEEDARIHTVRLTSDSQTIARIKRVEEGIRNGKSVNAFSREIVEIMRITKRIRL